MKYSAAELELLFYQKSDECSRRLKTAGTKNKMGGVFLDFLSPAGSELSDYLKSEYGVSMTARRKKITPVGYPIKRIYQIDMTGSSVFDQSSSTGGRR